MLFAAGSNEGTGFGRRARTSGLILNFWRSRAVFARNEIDGAEPQEVIPRMDQDAQDTYIPLFTGNKQFTPLDDSWENEGGYEVFSEDPHPMFIRSVTPAMDRETVACVMIPSRLAL